MIHSCRDSSNPCNIINNWRSCRNVNVRMRNDWSSFTNDIHVCRFVKTAISFTQPIQRDKAPSTSYQYLWGTKVLALSIVSRALTYSLSCVFLGTVSNCDAAVASIMLFVWFALPSTESHMCGMLLVWEEEESFEVAFKSCEIKTVVLENGWSSISKLPSTICSQLVSHEGSLDEHSW